MKRIAETTTGLAVGAMFIAAIIAISILFQVINDAGQEAGGFIGFLAEWFFG
jgi:hypothetical protein